MAPWFGRTLINAIWTFVESKEGKALIAPLENYVATITAKKKLVNAWLFFRWHFSCIFFPYRRRAREKAEALFHRDINSMSNVCKEQTHTHTGSHMQVATATVGQEGEGGEVKERGCPHMRRVCSWNFSCLLCLTGQKRDEQMSHGPSCWLAVEEEEGAGRTRAADEAVRWGIRSDDVVSLSLSKRRPDTPDIVRKMNKN